MARTFTSGTATDGGGSVAANSAVVQGLIRDAMVANAAWTLVEEFTGTSGTIRNTVFKCAAAASGLPKDFYVIMQRTISTGAWIMFCAEDYDAGTHIATNIVVGHQSTNRTYDVNGFPNPACSINIAAASVQSNSPMVVTPGMAASMFWAVIVDTDHVVVCLGANGGYYMGAFTSFAMGAATDPMPICFSQLSSSLPESNSGTKTGMTRHTGAAGQVTSGPNAIFADPLATGSAIALGNELGFQTGADKLHDNKAWAYEMVFRAATSTLSTYGYVRGKPKKAARLAQPALGTAIGDTYTMQGNSWLVVGVGGTGTACLVDTGAA